MNKIARSAYYLLKPALPRRFQIFLRVKKIASMRNKYIHSWPILKGTDKPPEGWKGWPEGKNFALVLTHDVETTRGQNRCGRLMELEKKLGFRSSFNFVPERYSVSSELRSRLESNGFEIGVHGLNHDGRLFRSREIFMERCAKINCYLKQWNAVGFRAPSMHHNLAWMTILNIEYDLSTFDTDPFEPQSDSVSTIYPFMVGNEHLRDGFVEMPYTVPQDFTLFILMKEKNIEVWCKKLEWIAEAGGMVLVDTHPDYMNFGDEKTTFEQYPAEYYQLLLEYVMAKYKGRYWHVLPKDMAAFWKSFVKV
jgi:peptidoglycan/xylan/chitin deacetylase (PgdA/CDA1 family)